LVYVIETMKSST